MHWPAQWQRITRIFFDHNTLDVLIRNSNIGTLFIDAEQLAEYLLSGTTFMDKQIFCYLQKELQIVFWKSIIINTVQPNNSSACSVQDKEAKERVLRKTFNEANDESRVYKKTMNDNRGY